MTPPCPVSVMCDLITVITLLQVHSLVSWDRVPTSCLCDGGVGGGLHRHGCGRSFTDGGGREVSETRLSSSRLGSRTASVTEGVLDHSLVRREQPGQERTAGSDRATPLEPVLLPLLI